MFSAIRNIKEISKEVIPERRKIISKGRPKMPIEILILENDKCEHEPYNITIRQMPNFKGFIKSKVKLIYFSGITLVVNENAS